MGGRAHFIQANLGGGAQKCTDKVGKKKGGVEIFLFFFVVESVLRADTRLFLYSHAGSPFSSSSVGALAPQKSIKTLLMAPRHISSLLSLRK